MEKVNFIPCLTWVERGAAKARPERVKHTREELKEIIKELKLKEAEFVSRPKQEGETRRQETDSENDDVDNFYEMDNYDQETTEEPVSSMGIENLLLNNPSDSGSEYSDVEEDEFTVKSEDNLILVGHVDDDVCMLEVYVFNNDKAELFILHDIFLPSYPICIEWLGFNPKDAEIVGHYAAVGCITPEIDVWDLNTSGCLEPAFRLGSKKKGKQRHQDAVLDLSWNRISRFLLASGSADHTVHIWDMAKETSILKLSPFEEKVQSLEWHALETQTLLTGSCEGKVRLFDLRSPSLFKTWIFEGEIERVMWNKFDPMHYFATTDQGMVHYVDVRNSKPIWNLKAHDKEVTGVTLSSHCKDLMVTASMDETVKIWDLQDQKPQLVSLKNMNIGSIYTVSSCPDVPYVFCAGGNKKDNHLYLWDAREDDRVMQRFKNRRFVEIDVEVQKESTEVSMEGSEEPIPGPSSSQSSAENKDGGRIHSKKKKKSTGLVKKVREEAAGPSNKVATTKKKKSHKKLHPKTPKDKSANDE